MELKPGKTPHFSVNGEWQVLRFMNHEWG